MRCPGYRRLPFHRNRRRSSSRRCPAGSTGTLTVLDEYVAGDVAVERTDHRRAGGRARHAVDRVERGVHADHRAAIGGMAARFIGTDHEDARWWWTRCGHRWPWTRNWNSCWRRLACTPPRRRSGTDWPIGPLASRQSWKQRQRRPSPRNAELACETPCSCERRTGMACCRYCASKNCDTANSLPVSGLTGGEEGSNRAQPAMAQWARRQRSRGAAAQCPATTLLWSSRSRRSSSGGWVLYSCASPGGLLPSAVIFCSTAYSASGLKPGARQVDLGGFVGTVFGAAVQAGQHHRRAVLGDVVLGHAAGRRRRR